MTLGDKLVKLRRENNYTQEQLAELLGVSRQAVSKWENNIAYPETEQLIRLGKLYGCSMDYLLKDAQNNASLDASAKSITLNFKQSYYEKKSRKTIFGVPLVHINIGYGRTAKGIIAIGLTAKGILSFGLISFGILSFGALSLGLLAFGVTALGLLAAGAISCGVIAAGAISIGLLSLGALSVGYFSVGALSVGKYFAMGDHAKALIALGNTKAAGSAYQKIGELTSQDISRIKALLDESTPVYLAWAKNLIKLFLS